MCTTCGCGVSNTSTELHSQHTHETATRTIAVQESLFAKNDAYAAINRDRLKRHRVLMLNLMSSPGAGKTTLLVETLKRLHRDFQCAVIEGDQQTDQDARRIRETDTPAVQINTGQGCHLDAHQIGHAMENFTLPELDILFVENVGNLVCPAGFDLGERAKVVIFSVTEGADKPLKYPNMFEVADLLLIHKVDLLPYVDFDINQAVRYAHQINPGLQIIQTSTKARQEAAGEGLESWYAWLSHAFTSIG